MTKFKWDFHWTFYVYKSTYLQDIISFIIYECVDWKNCLYLSKICLASLFPWAVTTLEICRACCWRLKAPPKIRNHKKSHVQNLLFLSHHHNWNWQWQQVGARRGDHQHLHEDLLLQAVLDQEEVHSVADLHLMQWEVGYLMELLQPQLHQQLPLLQLL